MEGVLENQIKVTLNLFPVGLLQNRICLFFYVNVFTARKQVETRQKLTARVIHN